MEYLVSRGHDFHDVLDVYTMEQITVFVESARKNRNAEIADIATAFRFSQATEKDWKRYIGSLTNTEPRSKVSKVATSEQIAHLKKVSGRAG